MKKILILIFMLLLIIPINIYAKEEVVPDEGSEEYSNVEYLPNKKSFNYLELKIDNHVEERINYYNDLLMGDMSSGFDSVKFLTTISFYSDNGELLKNSSLSISYFISGRQINYISLEIDFVTIINLSCFGFYYFDTNDYFDVQDILNQMSLSQ